MLKEKTLIYEYCATQNITRDERDYYYSTLTEEEKKHVEELKQENERLLDNHPFYKIKPTLTAGIMNQEKGRKKEFFYLRLLPVPAFACLCFVVIMVITGNLKNDPYQRKGNNIAQLFVYELADDTTVHLLHHLSPVKGGAFLQLGYKVKAETYGLIISVDSNRLITYHLKAGSNNPVLLTELNEMIYLPYSYRLDNTPGFELFLFITSDNTFSGDKIIDFILYMRKRPGKRTIIIND